MNLMAIVLTIVAQAGAPDSHMPSRGINTVQSALDVLNNSQAKVGDPKPTMPLGNPGEWATTADYPVEALRGGIEGTVGFILTVSPVGTVSECKVSLSSGSALLDSKTCELIVQRARFSPATDPQGKPTTGSYSNRVRWLLPKGPQKIEPMTLTSSFLVSTDGIMSDCRVERREGAVPANVPQIGPTPCPKERSAVEPFLDASGRPIARRVRLTQTIETLAP